MDDRYKPGHLGLVFVMMLCLTFSPDTTAASGDCTTTGTPAMPGSSSVTLSIPRDLPIGAAIAGSQFPISWSVRCKSSGVSAASTWSLDFLGDAIGTTAVPGMDNVYVLPKGMPDGIGFRVIEYSNALPFIRGSVLWASMNLGEATPGQTSFDWFGAIELVKTKAIPATGGFSISLSGQVPMSAENRLYFNGDQVNSTVSFHWDIDNAAFASCTIMNKNVAVAMPPITSAELKYVGATSKSKAFQIDLNCSAGTTLRVTLTDATKPDNRGPFLTPGVGSTARGIAYVIYNNGRGVYYGADSPEAGNPNQFLVATEEGSTAIRLSAAYRRTDAVLRSGSLTGKATFTLSYQ